jgi:Flp pilus assembly protein TadB
MFSLLGAVFYTIKFIDDRQRINKNPISFLKRIRTVRKKASDYSNNFIKKKTSENNMLLTVNTHLNKLLILSNSKLSVESFYTFSFLFGIVSMLLAILVFSSIPQIAILFMFVGLVTPYFFYVNKRALNSREISKQVIDFIRNCLEVSISSVTARDIVNNALKDLGSPLKELMQECVKVKEIPIHLNMYDLGKALDEKNLILFSRFLKYQSSSGGNFYDAIDNFYDIINNNNDVKFNKRLARKGANMTFRNVVFLYGISLAAYRFFLPQIYLFYKTPFGQLILTISIVLLVINLILIIIENVR